MRHAITLERAKPPSLTASRSHVVGRFRRAHAGLSLLHLAQAALVLLVAGDIILPITHEVGARPEPMLDVSVGVLLAAYFLAAAVNHGASATVLYRTFLSEVHAGRNRIRWAEYAVSAPILMLLVALYTGVTDVTRLVVMGAATLAMIVCGWMQESLNPPGRRTTTMVPFWAGVAAAVVPWSIVAVEMISGSGNQVFGLSTYLSLVILWASFALNQWLQYRQKGPWADFVYGEQAYLALSLVAKSALAWQIVAGTSLI